MKRNWFRLAAIGAGLASLAACATEGGAERDERTRQGFADAAMSPLRDINLVRPEVPDILRELNYPYATLSLAGGCPNILYEIGQLDAVLGEENYQPDPDRPWDEQGMNMASDAAVNAANDMAGDFVPFRGWVRRLSGASEAQARYAAAIEMGQTRRAFLRGYGASLGCRGVVPPPPIVRTRTQGQPQAQQQTTTGVGSPP